MEEIIRKFRDGIVTLHNRRFGTVAELMVQALYGFDAPKDKHHDFYDKTNERRIEVKASAVREGHDGAITWDNIIDVCLDSSSAGRLITYEDALKGNKKFSSPALQLKPGKKDITKEDGVDISISEFDDLYYCLFFADYIKIFIMTNKEVLNLDGYSEKHHKTGEMGQFHITEKNLDKKFGAISYVDYIKETLTYEELFDLFEKNKLKHKST